MGTSYKLKYSELATMNEEMKASAKERIKALEAFEKDVKSFGGSSNITGNTADAMKSYFPGVFLSFTSSLILLIDHQAQRCNRYVKAYESANFGGDTQVDAVELDEIGRSLVKDVNAWSDNGAKATASASVLSECGVSVPNLSTDGIVADKQHYQEYNKKVYDRIDGIESQFNAQKGSQEEQMIFQMQNGLTNIFGKLRASKDVPNYEAFTANDFLWDESADAVRKANLALWYDAYKHRDERENIGGAMFADFKVLEEMLGTETWVSDEDLKRFESLKTLPYEEWPEDMKQYYSWKGCGAGLNDMPRNGPVGDPRFANEGEGGDWGNCTWFAFGRFMSMQGKGYEYSPQGDAYQWATPEGSGEYAYHIGTDPTVGSIVCWDYGTGENGHVAVVEKKIWPCEEYPNGAIVVSQSGWSGTFITSDVCPCDENGNYTMYYDGTEKSATYTGCIYPDAEYDTPLGTITAKDKGYLLELAQNDPDNQ